MCYLAAAPGQKCVTWLLRMRTVFTWLLGYDEDPLVLRSRRIVGSNSQNPAAALTTTPTEETK